MSTVIRTMKRQGHKRLANGQMVVVGLGQQPSRLPLREGHAEARRAEANLMEGIKQ